jgi:uncharacterized protein YqfA (UPF0365 family)
MKILENKPLRNIFAIVILGSCFYVLHVFHLFDPILLWCAISAYIIVSLACIEENLNKK